MILPIVRSGERATYKRCPKKWYWAWRKGYVLKSKTFGALDLGTWWHAGLAKWYGLLGLERNDSFAVLFGIEANVAIQAAQENNAPDHVIEQADELAALGLEMALAYETYYGTDPGVNVLATEVHLEFTIPHLDTGKIIAVHRLTPDLIYMDRDGNVWLMEHKTAKAIRTEHLSIDDQARPYGSMAERALRKAKILMPKREFKGIMYNFARKALPDQRPTNSKGQYLNKDQSVSKSQPPAYFVRKPVVLSRKAKLITLKRVQLETMIIVGMTKALRNKEIDPRDIPKTPHTSCPRFCEFFTICEAEEEGTDIREMERALYRREDPYATEETSDEVISFEFG